MEKTYRAPTPRTQRAASGVTTRIARTLGPHTLAFAFIATHAAFLTLTPLLTHFLRGLSGIHFLQDYDHASASIRLCCGHDGIRSQHDHDFAASIQLCCEHDYDHEYEHDYAFSASIRLC